MLSPMFATARQRETACLFPARWSEEGAIGRRNPRGAARSKDRDRMKCNVIEVDGISVSGNHVQVSAVLMAMQLATEQGTGFSRRIV